MVKGVVVATPHSALPYAVVIRSDRTILRREPAYSMDDADRLLERLLADARDDLGLSRRGRSGGLAAPQHPQ
jgi:hypothetical protein